MDIKLPDGSVVYAGNLLTHEITGLTYLMFCNEPLMVGFRTIIRTIEVHEIPKLSTFVAAHVTEQNPDMIVEIGGVSYRVAGDVVTID